MLGQVAAAAHASGRPLSVCGEMAGQPLEAVLLVGLGIRNLSMAPSAIPRVKAALRAVSAAHAREVADRCLSLPTRAEIEALLRRELLADPLGPEPARRS
jgi:phosphoenolpyruvate-protein kinase (PTS system EI component)